MAYCHECGEKVAENDIFCPYCGISLQPLPLGGEDFSMDQTIVGEPPAFSHGRENNNFDEQPYGAVSLDPADSQTGDLNQPADEEEFDMKTESVEIPAEAFEGQSFPQEEIFGDARKIAENRPVEQEAQEQSLAQNSENHSVDQNEISQPGFLRRNESFEPVPPPENIEILQPLENAPNDASGQSNAPAQNYVPAEEIPAETGEILEIPETVPPIPAPDPADSVNFDERIYAPEDESSAENAAASGEDQAMESETESEAEVAAENRDNAPEQESAEPDEFEAETSLYPSGSPVSEEISGILEMVDEPTLENVENPVPEAIARPEDDLEPVPRKSGEAIYDSVRIVQKEEPVEAQPAAAEDKSAAPEQKEGRSYTMPNITGSDTDGKGSSKLKPLDEGTVLNNRYEIVRKIGGGGMGAVYLASDKNLGGVLRAVKEMVQSYIEEAQQDKAVADFKRESMLLTSLEHQAIPTIFDYFYDEKEARFYLVMKYISGGDLASRLRSAPEGKIDEQTVTEWAIQVADVLDYLHNRQPPIVYRDLKPANIMIDGNSGRIMLIDFGIARWINKEEKGVTAVGTMGYAPPELFSGNVDARSDIYSLGSTMFHLLTGADPQSNPLLIFDFQKNPRPRQINSQLSDQMERILMKSVEYNSDKRFATAADFRKTLQEHLENLKASRVTFGVKEIPQSVALSEQPVFCGFCGQKIVATDMFCAFCGAKQPIAQQGVHIGSAPGAGGYVAPSKTAKLMILGTNDLESPSFYLEKDENLVGRRDPMSNIFPEIDLSKFDPQTKISRRHARIWREGSRFMVEDLGSSNGTILLPAVNDTVRLLPHQPHVLSNGDKLKVGDTTMHFVLG